MEPHHRNIYSRRRMVDSSSKMLLPQACFRSCCTESRRRAAAEGTYVTAQVIKNSRAGWLVKRTKEGAGRCSKNEA